MCPKLEYTCRARKIHMHAYTTTHTNLRTCASYSQMIISLRAHNSPSGMLPKSFLLLSAPQVNRMCLYVCICEHIHIYRDAPKVFLLLSAPQVNRMCLYVCVCVHIHIYRDAPKVFLLLSAPQVNQMCLYVCVCVHIYNIV